MPTRLLLGNEALAQGALDAGLSAAYAYPGTPSTEITEYVLRSPEVANGDVVSHWTANEKTALEAALGASHAGKRAMASMKHVGLNVAADPFVNSAIAGANGGLIINVADDPSMHSSQNEQDSRVYLDLALLPCVEPADQQEAYRAPSYAFDLSERHRIPLLIRLTTRLSHSRGRITLGEKRPQNEISLPVDPKRYILLPALARRSYARLVERQSDFVRESEKSPFNRYIEGTDRSLGVIACGIAYGYVLDAIGSAWPHPILKIGQYPIPDALLREIMGICDRVIVLEEGFPYVEAKLRGLPVRSSPAVHGRLTGHLPRVGELTPEAVADALGLGRLPTVEPSSIPVPRPPAFCPGCPHADTCNVLNDALAARTEGGVVFSDIGCYTLGALPPYEAIDTCIEMGASITMAKGASAAGTRPAIALIGDSTFTHSGLTGLLDCVNENADVTVVIVDNLTVAMTGGQPSSAENRLAMICAGLGIERDHIRIIEPHPRNRAENVAVLEQEIAHSGPSVIIAQRECIQTARRRARMSPPEEEGETR
jgi:indolepyruvate ferredoxin oxidoreductase alpha subunit